MSRGLLKSTSTGLRSFFLAIPLAGATSAVAWYGGTLTGGKPELAFLQWVGAGTIVINSLGVFAFWVAILELFARSRQTSWEESAFRHRLLSENAQDVITDKSIPKIFEKLKEVPEAERDSQLYRAVELCASKYQTSTNVGEVAGTVQMHLDSESGRLETGYSLVRYLAWSIPSIGFIGTVMGLSSALGRFGAPSGGKGESENAVSNTLMSDVSRDLMLAFNTTFVALVLAVILMYYYHKVSGREDGLMNRVSGYCLRFFIMKAYYA